MNDITNDTVTDTKGYNIVNDSFAHKPDGLLVIKILIVSGTSVYYFSCNFSVRCLHLEFFTYFRRTISWLGLTWFRNTNILSATYVLCLLI